MNSGSRIFIELVRLGIKHKGFYSFSQQISEKEWQDIQALAIRQGLDAIVLDGIEKLPENQRPPKKVLLEWIGGVLKNFECRYNNYQQTIVEMAEFYNAHNIGMMVLKGYACGLNWHKPEHRPCGDIDIWLFGKQKEADAILKKKNGIRIESNEHHHTVFYWNDFMVEDHYDFINIHHHKSNVRFEKILKELGQDHNHYVEIKDISNSLTTKVYIPSPNLHMLFLLRHAMIEFAACGLNFRQLLDWAFFMEKHGRNVDWDKLLPIIDSYHMNDFFNVINAICVEELGFSSSIFPCVQFNPILKEKVVNDIISSPCAMIKPKNVLIRVIWKYRRWRANEWKHKLCYKERMWNSFWSGVWSHILKPSSI